MIIICKKPAALEVTTRPANPNAAMPKRFTFDGQNYTVDTLLGCGGQGHVYSACSDSGTTRAIKIVDSHDVLDNEVALGMKIRSPHVVKTHGIADTDVGVQGIVMDLAQGTNVKDMILNAQKTGGSIPLDQIKQIILGIALGLNVLHTHGILHRDVKPSNAVFANGTTQIFDFGIATDLTTSTTLGLGTGTLLYAAHEQLFPDRRTSPSPSADIFSLATTGYELLFNGKLPFELDTVQELPEAYRVIKFAVHKMCSDRHAQEIARLEKFGLLGRLISQGLHPDPNMRPDLDKFITALS